MVFVLVSLDIKFECKNILSFIILTYFFLYDRFISKPAEFIHWACRFDYRKTVEILMDNAESYYIDINIKDNDGRNGFQLAKHHKSKKVATTLSFCLKIFRAIHFLAQEVSRSQE